VEALITGANVDWSRRAADGVLVFRDPRARAPVDTPAPPLENEPAGHAP
jgi:hypothetical protein